MSALPILAIVVLAVLACVAWWLRRRARSSTPTDEAAWRDTVAAWPPTATRVLSSLEIRAYKTLVRALPGHMVLAKVPLARFVKVPARHSYSEWLRRLGYQCADLVVCDMASEVIAVVNVRRANGAMSERAIKRHARLARSLKAAGIPLHDWTDDALPTVERAREIVLSQTRASTPPLAIAADVAELAEPDTLPGEADERREPPTSTWFDEFNSGPVPLNPAGKGDPAPANAVSSAAPARTRAR